MKPTHLAVIAALAVGSSPISHAESGFDLKAVDRIVVTSEREAVPYKDGPAFHELKKIIMASLATAPVQDAGSGPSQYDVVLFSGSDEHKYALGARWLKGSDGTRQIPSAEFTKMMHIIESRAGEGVPK